AEVAGGATVVVAHAILDAEHRMETIDDGDTGTDGEEPGDRWARVEQTIGVAVDIGQVFSCQVVAEAEPKADLGKEEPPLAPDNGSHPVLEVAPAHLAGGHGATLVVDSTER